MRRYWDFTEKERSELTYEQVESLLTVELMEKGVVKVPPLELEPEEKPVLEKTTYYLIKCGYAGSPLVFATAADAEKAMTLAIGKKDCGISYHDDYSVFKPDQMTIEPVQLLQQHQIADVRSAVEKYEAAKKTNEQRRKDHAASMQAAQDAVEGVWDDWNAHRATARGFARVLEVFDDYTRTCEGDKATARKFLEKVYTPADIDKAIAWCRPEELIAAE
jgi:hypothetical protein